MQALKFQINCIFFVVTYSLRYWSVYTYLSVLCCRLAVQSGGFRQGPVLRLLPGLRFLCETQQKCVSVFQESSLFYLSK